MKISCLVITMLWSTDIATTRSKIYMWKYDTLVRVLVLLNFTSDSRMHRHRIDIAMFWWHCQTSTSRCIWSLGTMSVNGHNRTTEAARVGWNRRYCCTSKPVRVVQLAFWMVNYSGVRRAAVLARLEWGGAQWMGDILLARTSDCWPIGTRQQTSGGD